MEHISCVGLETNRSLAQQGRNPAAFTPLIVSDGAVDAIDSVITSLFPQWHPQTSLVSALLWKEPVGSFDRIDILELRFLSRSLVFREAGTGLHTMIQEHRVVTVQRHVDTILKVVALKNSNAASTRE